MIGKIIDPVMHTGALIGWLDNHDGRLRLGQFITATIQLPADPAMVAVPAGALIEEGPYPAVFVETDAERHEVTRRNVAVTRRGRNYGLHSLRAAGGGTARRRRAAESRRESRRFRRAGTVLGIAQSTGRRRRRRREPREAPAGTFPLRETCKALPMAYRLIQWALGAPLVVILLARP